MSGQTLRPVAPPVSGEQPGHTRRLRLSVGLVGAVWAVGIAGALTPLGEWPALFLYVLGALWITYTYCRTAEQRRKVGITRRNLNQAILWGGGIGLVLMFTDWVNTYFYYRGGGALMAEMEAILVGMRLLYLFPILVLAEEFLWRGMLLSALHDRGINKYLAIVLTTAVYAVNHFFVAPVGLWERGLMALMALPIGLIGGYVVLRTRNVWAGVLIHMLTFVSMVADIFIIPRLV